MRSYKIYTIVFLFLVLLSCDEKFVIVDCSDCQEEEPVDVTVTVAIDNRENSETTINVYEGSIEDNILIKSFYSNSNEAQIRLTVNRRYTFTAVYRSLRNSNTTVVVNSVYPRVRYETSQCPNPCYYVYDTNVRLKLKYKNF